MIKFSNLSKILTATIFLILISLSVFADDGYAVVEDPSLEVVYKVQPFYRYRPDGQPGREVLLKFKNTGVSLSANLEIICGDTREKIQFEGKRNGMDSVTFLLPPGIGVEQEAEVALIWQQGKINWNKTIKVPALRHWTVYVYPHSHVDIGYSNTHRNVEIIHKRNIDHGIKLAEETKHYPEGARYLWNTEVLWPVERYMKSVSEEKREFLLEAVKRGQLCLDAAYVHVNTSTCGEEELFQLFKYRSEMEKMTGTPVDVMVQVDLPGMSWGIVPVLAQEGIRYIMMMPNSTRGNQKMTYALNQKPFWWVSGDGKSRVLFFQPGSYGHGLWKGGSTGRPWFGEPDIEKIPEVIKTDNPRKNFLDNHLFETLPLLEAEDHPYDIFVVTWAMWDNAPLDADLPDAVKSWNEEYAYPRLVISNAGDIMQTIEQRYGNILPEIKGDYTEYWTDNMGVSAKNTRMNRNAKARLQQAETLWTMLNQGSPAPREEFDEAWRYVILASEHTYGSENPLDPFFFDAIWKVKQSYFREAEDRSLSMLDLALAPAMDRSLGALGPVEGPSNGGVAVVNTHSWNHSGLVSLKKIESQHGDRVVDDRGNEVRSQRLSTGELVFLASDVPAFGSRHYRVVPGKCPLPNACTFTGNTLTNGLLNVKIDRKTGNITGLVESGTGKNYADGNEGLNTFVWQPGRGAGDAMSDYDVVIQLKESGPLLSEVQISSKAPGCRSVERTVRLVHGQSWLALSNTVDKLPLVEKDGIHFGYNFDIPKSTTHVDIPWNVMQLEKDQWPAANRAWMVTQHWVDISNNEKGVTWCSLDAPLFESGEITANNTASWDGKGDVWPLKLQPGSTIYSWVMNNHWFTNTPLTQDGPVTFRYGILPHGSYSAAESNRFGLEQAQPLVPVLCSKNPFERPYMSINNDKAFVTVLKSTADGKAAIVRLRSFSETDEYINLSWPGLKPASLFVCDRGEEAGKMEVSGGVFIPAMGMITLKAEW